MFQHIHLDIEELFIYFRYLLQFEHIGWLLLPLNFEAVCLHAMFKLSNLSRLNPIVLLDQLTDLVQLKATTL